LGLAVLGLLAVLLLTAAPAGAFTFEVGRNIASIRGFGAAFNSSADRTAMSFKTTAPVVGDELRSIFWVDALQLEQAGGSYNSGSNPELTGLLYDLECLAVNNLGGGVVQFLYGSAGAYADTFTGRLDVYADPANNHNGFTSASNPNNWSAVANGSAGTEANRDTFPTYSDGSLLLSATLLPIPGIPQIGGKDVLLTQTFIGANGSTVLWAHMDVVYNNNGAINPTTWDDGVTSDMRFFATYFPNSINLPNNQWPIRVVDPVEFDVAPEPATLTLLGCALFSLVPVVRRRKK
jgi:hypothetical protein